MSEFWAAIAGAMVGGVIALGIQLIALRAARIERETDAASKKKALGHALLFKMIRIYSHLRFFNLHLQEARKHVEGGALIWQAVVPIANCPDRIHFTTDEMVMLLDLKDFVLFNSIVEMDERHNSTIAAFETYRDRRSGLGEILPSKIQGVVGTVELTDDQMRVLAPRMVELDMLLGQLAHQSDDQEREAKNALGRLRDLLVNKAGLTISIEDKSTDELLPKRVSAPNPA